MIALTCPGCGKSLNVKDEFAGKRGKCPHCKQPVTIPAPAAAPTVMESAPAYGPPPTVAPEVTAEPKTPAQQAEACTICTTNFPWIPPTPKMY
jgi:phage FluMu protein Com